MRWIARWRTKAGNARARLNAIKKLEKYGRSETALIASLLSDPANEVRAGACQALGRLKDASAIQRLGDLMLGRFGIGESGDRRFAAIAAAKALAQIGDGQSIPLLIQALGNIDQELRAEAARILGRLRATAAVEPLISLLDALNSSSERVQLEAVIALAEISGKRANTFVLEVFQDSRHLRTFHDDRSHIALSIWVAAAKGCPVDKQVLTATATLAENERLKQKLPEFSRIIEP